MKYQRKIDPAILKPNYDLECINCHAHQQVKPSVSMEFGLNTGSAKCESCETQIHIALYGDDMIGDSLEEHVERLKKDQHGLDLKK